MSPRLAVVAVVALSAVVGLVVPRVAGAQASAPSGSSNPATSTPWTLRYSNRDGGTSLTYNTSSALRYPVQDFDTFPAGSVDAGTPFQFIAPATGYYRFNVRMYISRGSAGYFASWVELQYTDAGVAAFGHIMDPGTAGLGHPALSDTLYLVAGEKVHVYGGYNDGTGSGTKTWGGGTGARNYITIEKL
jgi:hypothetical protein